MRPSLEAVTVSRRNVTDNVNLEDVRLQYPLGDYSNLLSSSLRIQKLVHKPLKSVIGIELVDVEIAEKRDTVARGQFNGVTLTSSIWNSIRY